MLSSPTEKSDAEVHRADSLSPQNSTGSWSTRHTRRSPPTSYTGLLMPDPPEDEEIALYKRMSGHIRKAFQRDIFDNTHVDWKSIPVVEESEHVHAFLLAMPKLRCDGSHELRAQILADARATFRCLLNEEVNETGHHERPLITGSVTRNSDQTQVEIDGDTTVDMIG